MSALRETTSYPSVPRDRHKAVVTPAASPGLVLLRRGTKLAGSPGSAVFPDETWNEVLSRLGLSHREGEIVRGVFDDQTEFAIAANLGISPHTVHTHCERLHHKLGVADRVQLVLRVTQEFLRLGALAHSSHPSLGVQRPARRI